MRNDHRLAKLLAATLITLSAAGCGSQNPQELVDAGYQALGSNDAAGAKDKFESALSKLDAKDAGFARAKLGLIEALVSVDDARAKQDLLAFGKQHPELVKPSDYLRVANLMVNKGKIVTAAETIEDIKDLVKGDPKAEEVRESIRQRASKVEDPAQVAKLKSLGYL